MKPLWILTAGFARRSRQEQHLLVSTALLFVVAHMLLRGAAYARALTGLQIMARLTGARAHDSAQLAWAAATISQHLPGAHSCLVQALCCQVIAKNSGFATQLKIGALRAGAAVHFHAWVEQQGRIICGYDEREFVPLT